MEVWASHSLSCVKTSAGLQQTHLVHILSSMKLVLFFVLKEIRINSYCCPLLPKLSVYFENKNWGIMSHQIWTVITPLALYVTELQVM